MFLFVGAGASRFFDAVAANDQELVCQALGIKYEAAKSAHTDNDDMDTILAHKFHETFRSWVTPQAKNTITGYIRIVNTFFVSASALVSWTVQSFDTFRMSILLETHNHCVK